MQYNQDLKKRKQYFYYEDKCRVLNFYSLGGFLLRKNQAFQGYAIASFLRYASELASPALTILATVCKSNTRN